MPGDLPGGAMGSFGIDWYIKCRLQTKGKMQARGKMQNEDRRLGVKCRILTRALKTFHLGKVQFSGKALVNVLFPLLRVLHYKNGKCIFLGTVVW